MFDYAINFVPVQNYGPYFDLAILVLILLALFQCQNGSIIRKDTVNMNATMGLFLVIILILYMGLRPVSYVFGDTMNYAREFNETLRSKQPFEWKWETEWLFHNMQNWFAKNSNIHAFFLLCATTYVGSLWLACVRIFKNYYYLPLLVIFAMFTFWAYGVNGIRNGMGASLFILAMTFPQNIPIMGTLAVLGLGMHSSVALMIGAAGLAYFIKNSYYYLAGWLACLVVSFTLGTAAQNFLMSFSIFQEDEKFSGYVSGSNQVGEIVQMSMTFRWDFVAYSALAVAVGYYFIFRRNYKDEYYHWLYNIFLTTNAFWLLVIRAGYSNRFAQISWFVMPLVLIYPFMKKRFWENHEKMLAIAILVFYAFGFYTNILKTNALSILF